MLVLSRKQGERIVVGRDIVLTILESRRGRVRVGIAAPQGTPIYREEMFRQAPRDERAEPTESYQEGSPFYAECG